MFRLLTRIICLMICFQLAVGCGLNSAQLSVTGADTFSFKGLIVKTFNNVNNLIFPSAMAATQIGNINIYDISDFEAPLLIASEPVYSDTKSFNITVKKADVENRPVQFSYVAIGATPDLRDLLDNTDKYENVMNVTLDANTTYRASLVAAELTKQIAADPNNNRPVVIGDEIENFDPSIYDDVKKVISEKEFASIFTNVEIRKEVASYIIDNPKPADAAAFEADIKELMVTAKEDALAATKLVCGTLTTVKDYAKYESAILYFDTTDKATMEVLGKDSNNLGKILNAAEGNKLLAEWDKKLKETVLAKGVALVGNWSLRDSNKGVTKCTASYLPKAPEASSAIFDKFVESDHGKLEEAVADLDKMYDATINQLRKDFEAAKIDPKSQAGWALYVKEVAIVDGWYNDYLDISVAYFLKK
jgi:hypothetical protein